MTIGKYEIKVKKDFIPKGYLLVYTMEKDESGNISSYNYVLNKHSGTMDKKKIFDGSFLCDENIFSSFEEVQNFIKDNISKIKSLAKFLGSGSIHSISYVEETIVERDNYEIKAYSIPLIWNRRERVLVPIELGDKSVL